MIEFLLNDEKKLIAETENLMTFLREKERITSVKNGCAQGACGACTVLIDKKAMKACVVKGQQLAQKSVTTIEGLDDFWKKAFAYSFSSCGAVQCGFCIPAMVMSASGLFYQNINPTNIEIKKALQGNICRCTGYVKIEQAIMLAAKIIREKQNIPVVPCKGLVGENLNRIDAKNKVLGTAEYCDDLFVEGMLHGAILQPPVARALVKSIDTREAEQLTGVAGVFTAKDIEQLGGNRYCGHLKKDWPCLVAENEQVRTIGDVLALVAAETQEIARNAIKRIKVDYEILPAITCPKEAMKETAAKIHGSGNILTHQVLKRGNAEEIIKKSKYVVTNTYSVPFTEHAFLEPESALAFIDKDDLIVYTGDQGVYDDLHEITSLLGLPEQKVRIIAKNVGGGFGGKEDMSVQHRAALMAWLLKRPVKLTLSRDESLRMHPKRHAMQMEFTTACDEHGTLTAMKARIIADTGAYASLGEPVLQRACTHAAGPYNYQNVDIEGFAVYTNNPPAGAFRGFGVTQSTFATESNINQLAQLVGISPWEMRFRNAIQVGQELPNGQIADEGTALKETLLAVKRDFEKAEADSNLSVGIACAFKNTGVGVGIPDIGRCILSVKDGKVWIYSSAVCIGQGLGTVLTQIVCQTLDLDSSHVCYAFPDTRLAPNSGTTTASRQTVLTGEATRNAALKLKAALKNKKLDQLNGEQFIGEYSCITDKMGSLKKNPVSHVAYGFATQVVILNGDGKIEQVIASHDVGRAINPQAVEGQIEGGVVMSLGYALTEDFPLKDAIPQAKFGTLGLFRSVNVPPIKTIIIEKNTSELAYGAKGVGEITSIPTAPAIQGAYYNFDGIFRTKLPLENTFYRRKQSN
ncbi:MAG: selenium-dependent xanthine dehydrogenase [Treponemataceae bacterium]